MQAQYLHFQVELDGSYFSTSVNVPFKMSWRSERKQARKLAAFEEMVWLAKGMFVPGYLFSYDNGMMPYERFVQFPKIPCGTIEGAQQVSSELVRDALKYPDGFLQKLGGAKEYL